MTYLNKTILITGAAGSIGSELARQIYKMKPRKLLLLDQDETRLFEIGQELPKTRTILGDVRNEYRITKLFEKYRPDIVFHTAAYKHVGMLEGASGEMWDTNVKGLRNVANSAVIFRASKFVFISSDKAVNAESVMGKSKAIGENYCKRYNGTTRFIAVRFGNVLTSRGSVLSIWQRQLDKGEPIEVTDERMERFFMTIFEACELVIAAAEIGDGGELFVFDMGEPIKILDLAANFIRMSGKNAIIKIIGKRKGEKLSEELTTNDERLEKTKHPKILKVCKNQNIK